MLLERIKIMVSVKQGMPLHQTKGCDQAVDGFADRLAAGPKEAIVPRGRNSQGRSSGVEYLELAQVASHSREG